MWLVLSFPEQAAFLFFEVGQESFCGWPESQMGALADAWDSGLPGVRTKIIDL